MMRMMRLMFVPIARRGAVQALAGIVITLAMMFMHGCRTVPAGPDDVDVTYSELAEAHNLRIERLSQIYSRGVIELRWRDDDGRHFEQGNIDLWIDLPRHTALRVEKLGNVFLWLGSDSDRYWLFDMLGDQTVLFAAEHDAATHAGAVLPVRPLALLDLVGLTRLPDPLPGKVPQVRFDQRRDAYVITAPGQGGVMRIFFDRSRRLPIRIESLNQSGEAAYRSDLQLARYRSVPRPGVASTQFGLLATLVDIIAAETSGVRDGEIKLALDAPTGFVENQPFDRVFDLDRLMRSMRPHHIEGDVSPR